MSQVREQIRGSARRRQQEAGEVLERQVVQRGKKRQITVSMHRRNTFSEYRRGKAE
ncbi:hypothetical protein SDC9_88740 [bioreactor metagenome]|uniref:Uncharacterized protein n=1 Tax=bioreactor metagenome TaxID=1076179 RepID=A0A644ZNZ3_9ZZZZ